MTVQDAETILETALNYLQTIKNPKAAKEELDTFLETADEILDILNHDLNSGKVSKKHELLLLRYEDRVRRLNGIWN